MNIPYRTRRLLNRIGLMALAVLLVGTLVWFCWVIWLERYVVYTEGKAILDFDITVDESMGELAVPPAADAGVPIYYNEGANAVNLNAELTQLNGYYIDGDDLQKNLADSYEDMKALRGEILDDLLGQIAGDTVQMRSFIRHEEGVFGGEVNLILCGDGAWRVVTASSVPMNDGPGTL